MLICNRAQVAYRPIKYASEDFRFFFAPIISLNLEEILKIPFPELIEIVPIPQQPFSHVLIKPYTEKRTQQLNAFLEPELQWRKSC
jgi:hypothetical protein